MDKHYRYNRDGTYTEIPISEPMEAVEGAKAYMEEVENHYQFLSLEHKLDKIVELKKRYPTLRELQEYHEREKVPKIQRVSEYNDKEQKLKAYKSIEALQVMTVPKEYLDTTHKRYTERIIKKQEQDKRDMRRLVYFNNMNDTNNQITLNRKLREYNQTYGYVYHAVTDEDKKEREELEQEYWSNPDEMVSEYEEVVGGVSDTEVEQWEKKMDEVREKIQEKRDRVPPVPAVPVPDPVDHRKEMIRERKRLYASNMVIRPLKNE